MRNFPVYIPLGISREPELHEKTAAQILANYFECRVMFIDCGPTHTADIMIGNVLWELKAPKGNSKRTIQNNLRKADNQSMNIVLDLRRIKMVESRAVARARYELGRATRIKKLLIITKRGKVLEIK